MQINRLNDRIIFIFIAFTIVIYPFLFIWQCGDVTDTGYFAVNYHFFIENLKIGNTESISFLSDVIGACWLKLFPAAGIIGLKILYLIFLYIIIITTYLILKSLTDKKILLLLGVFSGIAFGIRSSPLVFSRDIASWLFLILTAYYIKKGITSGNSVFLYISGILSAFACFSRFPDIILLAMLPFLFMYKNMYLEKGMTSKRFYKSLKEYLIFFSGFTSIILLAFAIITIAGLSETVLSNFTVVIDSLRAVNKNSYTLFSLLKSYFTELLVYLPHAIIVAMLIPAISLFFIYAEVTKKYWIFIALFVFLFYVAYQYYYNYTFISNIKYFVPAFCLPFLLVSIGKKDNFGIIALLLIIMALTQVAGTNTGLFLKLADGLIIIVPMTVIILAERKEYISENIVINTKPILFIGIFFILFFSVSSRIGWIYNVDSGLKVRLKAVYTVENSKMKGIYTTLDRANYINSLCKSIECNIKPENTLFIYGHKPLFYYLTNHLPPIRKYWITSNYVSADEVFNSLNASIKRTGKWPMIVDTKQSVQNEIGESKLSEFIKNNYYICVERNDNYIIWNKISK